MNVTKLIKKNIVELSFSIEQQCSMELKDRGGCWSYPEYFTHFDLGDVEVTRGQLLRECDPSILLKALSNWFSSEAESLVIAWLKEEPQYQRRFAKLLS